MSHTRSLSVSSGRVVDDEDGDHSDREDASPDDTPSPDDVDAEEAENAASVRQYTEDDPLTVKDRQSLMNVDHPFGLPIWKPALYKKSRTVNRNAETALHAMPAPHHEAFLHPGNIFWAIVFGLLLGVVCIVASAILFLVPWGGRRYAPLVYGLGWYLFWPFGKYVEGYDESLDEDAESREAGSNRHSHSDSVRTIRRIDESDENEGNNAVPIIHSPSGTVTQRNLHASFSESSWRDLPGPSETTLLKGKRTPKSYGTTTSQLSVSPEPVKSRSGDFLGTMIFWLLLVSVIAPLMLVVCLICWFLVVTIPMAKLNWALIKHMFKNPDKIRFCAAPQAMVVPSSTSLPADDDEAEQTPTFTIKRARLSAGQVAPSGLPSSTVLLCTYKAVGLQYYKYTVGGVNIFFVNLMAVVFFAIFDFLVLLPLKERYDHAGREAPFILQVLASQVLLFFISLASVIPLSYFIGMAVASISAQSSIGMGAVINATFGSIIEIILYGIALTQDKGRLVEGSIVGSLLAGVLLMPGASMCSAALRKKEQKFNAKSASVTSTMLIMAIIGTLTPTMFYQTYGSVRNSFLSKR